MTDSPLRHAAIVLISLGPRLSAEILKRLPEKLVERLTAEIAKVQLVEATEREAAFHLLGSFRAQAGGATHGGEDVAKQMLEAALGTHRASSLMDRATGFHDVTTFSSLKNADPLTVANFLKGESSQTTSLVLAYMDPRQAGPILALLPSEMQAAVAYKMAIFGTPNPEFVREVEHTLANQLKSEYEGVGRQFGGKKQVADLLNEIDKEVWIEILDDMKEIDEDTASDVKNLMFIFEDMVTLEDRYVQEVLKEIEGRELTYALKAASQEVKDKVLGNMSKRAAAGIMEDMDYLGPVRLSEVEEAQQRVVDVIRRLEEDGTIVLGGGAGDAVV